jgi:hypothetical protein
VGRKKRRPRSDDHSGLSFGCAGILLAMAGLVVFLGWHNHQWWLQRQQQIPRFQKIRATVREKGIARYDSKDSHGNTRTEYKKWIHFTCRIGDRGDKDGARLTLSGSDEGWDNFQNGGDYDAYYDPVVDECVLLVDEKVGEPDFGFLFFIRIAEFLGALSAVLLVVGVIVRLRRPPASATGSAP